MNETLEQIEHLIKVGDYDPTRFTNLDGTWQGLVGWHNSYYRWLWAAVKIANPHYIVEIGRERGVSATVMLDAMSPDARLDSIDIVEESVFLDNYRDSRLTKITGDSLDAHEYLRNDLIDFLFIDGEHTGEYVSKEWEIYRPKVRSGGIIVLDDIHFDESMTNFWNSITEEKYDISYWHERGFGVCFIS